MTPSIYARALGSDFGQLHPEIRSRFGFSSADGTASIGTGVMERIWRRPGFTRPFLAFGTWRQIMFPEQGVTLKSVIYRSEQSDERLSGVAAGTDSQLLAEPAG